MAYVTAAMAAIGAHRQRKAGEEAEDIAEANAARELEESSEAARKLKLQQDKVMAEARARSAASGIGVSGTIQTYLNEMKMNFKDELDWVKKSGASRAEIQRREGSYQRQISQANTWGTLANIDYRALQ